MGEARKVLTTAKTIIGVQIVKIEIDKNDGSKLIILNKRYDKIIFVIKNIIVHVNVENLDTSIFFFFKKKVFVKENYITPRKMYT